MMNSSMGDLDATENYYRYNNASEITEQLTLSVEEIVWTGIILTVCCVGLVGNGYIIWLLGFQMKRNCFTIFLLNVAITDFVSERSEAQKELRYLIMPSLMLSSLNSSINPVIHFLVGRKKGARSKESMKVLLQNVFKEEIKEWVDAALESSTSYSNCQEDWMRETEIANDISGINWERKKEEEEESQQDSGEELPLIVASGLVENEVNCREQEGEDPDGATNKSGEIWRMTAVMPEWEEDSHTPVQADGHHQKLASRIGEGKKLKKQEEKVWTIKSTQIKDIQPKSDTPVNKSEMGRLLSHYPEEKSAVKTSSNIG
ncbi:Mrgprh: Mas-related G-protein coupled receptor member H [Crotalus adamanteus]|uniref:Mrgprh: Mas-related G-protein coupled receptor member H n=1 Tax=Crotalus adamanteus TaxID=8729 RepID=A0AAW1BNB9_CROAD